MTQQNSERPSPKEVAKGVEEFVKNTPPDVVRKMREMHEERRQGQSLGNSGNLMTRRLG